LTTYNKNIGEWSTQPSIPPSGGGKSNTGLLVGVKARGVHLCRVAGNSGASDTP